MREGIRGGGGKGRQRAGTSLTLRSCFLWATGREFQSVPSGRSSLMSLALSVSSEYCSCSSASSFRQFLCNELDSSSSMGSSSSREKKSAIAWQERGDAGAGLNALTRAAASSRYVRVLVLQAKRYIPTHHRSFKPDTGHHSATAVAMFQ